MDQPFRILPLVTDENEHFWRGGAEGELRILRCQDCASWLHPPTPVCGECLSRNLLAEATSGRATVATFTINRHPWVPGFDPPYIIAIVELDEQTGLRLTTNLVNLDLDDVHIGMKVRVVFEERDEGIFLPLFEPMSPTGTGSEGGA
jgi:uncharacterized OB-fold protein